MKWFHFHKWEIAAAEPYTYQIFGGLVTTVLYRCQCGAIKTKDIDGHWTLAQVKGGAAKHA
jgi:hypothetical protein